MKEKKNNRKRKANLSVFIFLIIGAICGFYGGYYISKMSEQGMSRHSILIEFGLILLFVYFAVFLQTILHEGGHLLFGKLSGYKFVSFRIGSTMFLLENGKYKFKRFKIVGTGGQCIMMPPEGEEYDFPFVLYNLGGIIMNTFFSLIFLLLNFILPVDYNFSIVLVVLFIIGISFVLVNGIPMKINGIANDGYNAVFLGKDREARHAFWLTLRINGLISAGERMKDMPSQWFELSQNLDWNNHLICSRGGLRFSYLFDLKHFEEARELAEFLTEKAKGMLELQKKELCCELIFLELIGLRREEEINRLYTAELKKYIKATSSYVSRRRLRYAHELLMKNNKEEADRQLKAFEFAAKTYPFQGEIESERELIELVKEKALIFFDKR